MGPDHILSSIEFSKCELQPRLSRIPIRRVGSTETPPTYINASPSSSNPTSPGIKEGSATMRVWKLLKPGLRRHLSLSGVSGKEGPIQLASKALMKSTDRSFLYQGDAIIETTPETEELQEVKTEEYTHAN